MFPKFPKILIYCINIGIESIKILKIIINPLYSAINAELNTISDFDDTENIPDINYDKS